ncbi:MAG: aldehyde ferredoxin oxidoreductase family protein [Bacillota bacterium]|uniref:aldehyde ferredoxin oxidoreductase family protein n=1 Tax=Desulforudis sp. DRI-14 TaxID=3459793 RepID=UPI003478B9C1
MKGFYGKLLIVDLTSRTWYTEAIPASWFEKLLGGKGLGSWLLLREVKAGTDPLGPDNVLIFANGPATGTVMPGGSRYGVYARSPLTGAYAESYAGGRVALAFKGTGYDAVIIRGCAGAPVFIEIGPEQTAIRDAKDFWGLDAYAAEDALLGKVGVEGAQAVVIGPAGERLVRFACLQNNRWRSAGRTGLGAVMGSKNCKGVVFHGGLKAPVADEARLKAYVARLRAKCKGSPAQKFYNSLGTPGMVGLMNAAGALPTRYWSRGEYEDWDKISGQYMQTNYKVRSRSCPLCPMGCAKLTTVPDGPHRGLMIEGPEYETLYAFGSLCCINRLDEIVYLNDLCDRYGIDTITAGNLVGLAMAASERGRFPVRVAFGDAAAAVELVTGMVTRSGPGALLADGIKEAAARLGLEDLAVHVKGLEPAGYDPRVLKGMGLAYMTSTRGACHLRATFYKPELSGIIDPRTTKGKALLFTDYEDRLTIFNTMILCVFFRDFILWDDLSELIAALTGREYTMPRLRGIANRIVSLTRFFNVREGFSRADDALPERFYREPLAGGGIEKGEMECMLDEYYVLRGWNSQGVPGYLDVK